MAGLVAVGVFADKAGDVHKAVALLFLLEEGFQLGQRFLFAAQSLDQTFRILHDVPGVLPGVAFREVAAHSGRIEIFLPSAVEFLRSGETGLGIDKILPVFAALLEVLDILLGGEAFLLKIFSQLVGAPVVVGAFQRAGNGLRPLVAGIIARVFQVFPFLSPAAVVLFGKSVLDGSPDIQSFRDLALEISVHHGRNGVRADHALVILAPQGPDRQISGLLVVLDHGLHQIRHHLGNHDGEQGMQRPEGIPGAKSGIIFAVGSRADLAVGASVTAVNVRDVAGRDEGMVHAGVEDSLFLFRTFHLHPAEKLVPGVVRGLLYAFKIPAGDLRFHILGGTVGIGRGQSDLKHQGFVARFEDEDLPAAAFLLALLGESLLQREVMLYGTVEFDLKAVLAMHPAAFLRRAEHRGVVRESQLMVVHSLLVAVADAVREVEHDLLLFALGIDQAVDGRMVRAGGLDFHIEAVKLDGVVAGSVFFRLFLDGAFIEVRRRLRFADEGHEQKVAQVPYARSGNGRLGEAGENFVLETVAGAVAPAVVAAFRAWLHEAERHRGADEGVAVVRRADGRIHESRVIRLVGRTGLTRTARAGLVETAGQGKR